MLDHLKSEMGLEIVNGQIKENLFGKNLLAGHGDEYSGGDKAYILFKALLRASWFTSIYRLLHPDIAIPAGKMLSRGSRSKPKDRFRLVSRYYRNVVRKRFAEGYDIVITGHTHTPVLKVEKGRIYLNPGGWMIERTFAEMDEEKVRLMEWRENQGPVMLASTSMRSPVERDTSEIGYNL
jgi:UDP-2,3-diacylglucosamine pyrophosphatase LpxH